jgi:hypothetical protein
MRTTSFLLTGAAIGVACLLLAPRESQGYTFFGDTLNLQQRDLRVYNNFSKPGANNNTTEDDNWPGYTGAELAIWKGGAEWDSELIGGTGAGDPTQLVGSGNANFDMTWQGNAGGIGYVGQNVNSQISGGSGGVIAYCEQNSSGFRIRYYEVWNWQDGPGNEGGTDMQSIACHEIGHGLGLGHTNVGGSTMYPSYGGGVGPRSIAADDIAGLQARYGAKSASKPSISAVSASGNQVTITGVNFSPSNNEVWFTQAGSGGDGTPVKVVGVTSNGSSITVTLPVNAGPGSVMVRNNGSTGANLSNAWPFDPYDCGVDVYCTAKVASTGFAAQIGYFGDPSWSTQGFNLTNYNGGVAKTLGIYIYSDTGTASTPFANGILCLASPVKRGPAHQYDDFGFVNVPITIDVSQIGARRLYQFWFRDQKHQDGTGVGLSDALDVTFCP